MKKTILALLLVAFGSFSYAQDKIIKLWDQPQSNKEKRPELRVFFPADSVKNGTAIIICPGGSYHHLGLTNEGSEVAKCFNDWGVTAFVLRYRVEMYGNHHPSMIEDLQRAIQIVREQASEFGIDTSKVGCIGFSAGGHLVTMAGALSNKNFLAARGIKTQVDLKPDFVCPIYPVVSFQDSIVHKKSRKNFLGRKFTPEERDQYSLERQIPSDMPPVFLLACKDDDVVNYQNSIVLEKSLSEKKIPHKFILFENGGHGFGMIRTKSEESKDWNLYLKKWMQEQGFLPLN